MSGIFISYRRSDSAGHTGRLADDLGKQLDGQALFRDIEAIEAGVDFVAALERAVSACSVMLVIIGPGWATAASADGKKRLFQPGDFVRMEIEAALARDIRVIPVLVGDAEMPGPADMPDSMAALLRRNAYSISDRRWQYDVTQLVDILVKLPGVAGRKGAATQAVAAPLKRGMSVWLKAAFAAIGVLVVAVAALFLVPLDEEAPVTSVPSAQAPLEIPVAPPVEPTAPLAKPELRPAPGDSDFYGDWAAANGESYNIDLEESGKLYVAAGSGLDAGTGFGTNSAPATKPGEELFGNGAINGRRLKATLIDTVTGESLAVQLELSDDGKTLTGAISKGEEKSARQLSLTRR